jgi:DNA-binding MarR family transcriptional regulator
VHTIRLEAHILLRQNKIPHTNLDELFEAKIPALKGIGRKNNLLILETIAMEGPLLKYDVYKRLKEKGLEEYSTVTRRIDSLREKGYLEEADKRITARGKRKAESMYGLTWKGLVASLIGKKIRKDALQVIERNPLLVIPEKEFVLLILKDIFNPEEVERIANIMLYGYLKAIPNLEDIEEEKLGIWILPALGEIPPDVIKAEMIGQKKDLTRLLDNPRILQYVKDRILPKIAEYEKNLNLLLQFFTLLNQVGDYIKELNPEDKPRPSERLKEYLKNMKPAFAS